MGRGRIASVVVCSLFILMFLSALSSLASPPIPPSGISVIAGNKEASLTWSPVTGASEYLIYRANTAGGPYSFTGRTRVTCFADLGLTNGSTYHWVVTALNGEGQSTASTSVSTSPTLLALPAPDNVRVIPGNGEVTVTWEAVTSAVHYTVYRISTSGSITALNPHAQGGSYTDRSAGNGAKYHYVVQTMSTNPGAYSYTVAATPSSLLPKAPASLSATPGDQWASLSWAAVGGATGYQIYRATAIGGPFDLVGTVTTTSFLDKGLSNDASYRYVVTATNAHGISAYSLEAAAAPSLTDPPLPVELTGWPKNEGARLSWKAISNAVSYNVWRGSSSGFRPGGTLVDTVTTAAFTDESLLNGTPYFYVVETNNASGDKADSNEIRIEPAEYLPAPGIPDPYLDKADGAFPGNTQVTITWQPVEGAYSYTVFGSDTPGGTGFVASVSKGKTSYTRTSLTNGQTYYFKVRANVYSQSGSSYNYTREIAVTPSASLPLAPSSTPVGEAGNTQISLRWNAVAGASGYHIFRRTASSSWQRLTASPVSGTYYNDHGLTNDTAYSYSVMVVNTSGSGAWTVSERTLTPLTSLNLAPANVLEVPGNTQATITWQPVTGAERYSLQLAETPGGTSGLKYGNSYDGRTGYTFTGLTNGQTYYARVKSSSPYSAFSQDIEVIPQTSRPQAPPSPTVKAGNTQVSLTWSAVDNATGYKIYRRTRVGYASAVQAGLVSGTIFTDTGLDNGTSYYYSVSATNPNGEGPWSISERKVTPDADLQLPPTNLAGVKGNTELTLTWTPVAGATGYSVTIAATPGGNAIKSASTYNGKTSATITGLTNGKTYYARVRTSSPAGSAEIGEIPLTPSVLLPLAPSSLSCKAPGNTQATVGWGAVDNALSYRVYRRRAEGGWPATPVASLVNPIVTDSGLVNATPYYYVVSAVNGHGEGAWSTYEINCTPASDLPLAPAGVKVIGGNGLVSLSWTQVSGATKYQVLYGESPGSITYEPYVETTSHVVKDLENNRKYVFYIRAINNDGKRSAYSTEVSAMPSAAITDSDQDGIADHWEISFFGNLSTCNGNSDFDNDFYTDLVEYLNWKRNLVDPAGKVFNPKIVNSPNGPGYRVPALGESVISPIINLLLLND